jgi:hypothetical protein
MREFGFGRAFDPISVSPSKNRSAWVVLRVGLKLGGSMPGLSLDSGGES